MRIIIAATLASLLIAIHGHNPAGCSLSSDYPESRLSSDDEAFLEDLEHRAFLYFWEQADPRSGLVRDRGRTDGAAMDEQHRDVASIAATGFGLTALCIAADRHWLDAK